MQIIITLFIFIVNVFVLKQALSFRKGGFLNKFFIFYYIFQIVLALLILVLDFDYTIHLLGYSVKLKEAFSSYVIGSLFAIFGIFCGMGLLNYVCRTREIVSLNQQNQLLCYNVNVNILSILLSFVFIFNCISVFVPLYIIVVIFVTFSYSPVIVGFVWYKLNRGVQIYWVIVLLVGFLFHSVQGSRGYALMPIFLFVLGYFFSVKMYHSELLYRRTLVIILAALFLIPFLSKIQNFRESFGRWQDVTYDSISEFFSFMIESPDSDREQKSGIGSSLGRLLNNPNFTVPYMSPSLIPFRNTEAMFDEIQSIFVLNGEDGAAQFRLKRASLNYGVGVLSKYGYFISEKFSTGLSLFADGYSRFGYMGVFFYSFIYALILGFLENILLCLSKKNIVLSELLYFYILNAGLLSYGMTYYAFLKVILFRSILVFLVGFVIYKICACFSNK